MAAGAGPRRRIRPPRESGAAASAACRKSKASVRAGESARSSARCE
jgi:hypothetical protein